MLPVNLIYLDYKKYSNNLSVKVKKKHLPCYFCVRLQQELVRMHIRMCHCSESLCTLHFYHKTTKISISYLPITFVISLERIISDLIVT